MTRCLEVPSCKVHAHWKTIQRNNYSTKEMCKILFLPSTRPQACEEGGQGVYWIYVNGMCMSLEVYISFLLLLQNLSYFSNGSSASKNWCDINWWCSYAPWNSSLFSKPTLIKLLVGQLLICYRKGNTNLFLWVKFLWFHHHIQHHLCKTNIINKKTNDKP